MFPLGDTPKVQVRADAADAAWPTRTSPTGTTSASSPTATPRVSWPTTWSQAPGQIVDESGVVVGEHEVPAVALSASAAACASTGHLPTAGPITCWTSNRGPGRSPWDRSGSRHYRGHGGAARLDGLRPGGRAAGSAWSSYAPTEMC